MNRFLLALTVISVCLAACSSASTQQPQTEAGLKVAAKTYATAYYQTDTKLAYSEFSKTCRAQVSIGEFGAMLGAAKLMFTAFTGLKISDLTITDVLVRNFTPTKAEAAPIASFNMGSPSYYPYEYQDGTWVRTDCDQMRMGSDSATSTATLSRSTSPTTAATAPATATSLSPIGQVRAMAVAIGNPLKVGDWIVVVNAVTPDATAAVLAANQFNDKPAAGSQYFMANISVTYDGTKEPARASSLTFKAVGAANTSYSTGSQYGGVPPKYLDTSTDVFKGGKLTGNISWAVATSDVASLMMYVSTSSSPATNPVWFVLH